MTVKVLQTSLYAVMISGWHLRMEVNDVPSLEEGRRLDRRTQPRDQRGERSEGSNWGGGRQEKEGGEIKGWRNTQQGYGSFRQIRG